MSLLQVSGKDGLLTLTAVVLNAGGQVKLNQKDLSLAKRASLYVSQNQETGEVVLTVESNAITDKPHTFPR